MMFCNGRGSTSRRSRLPLSSSVLSFPFDFPLRSKSHTIPISRSYGNLIITLPCNF
nr:MAG TPA: hypothetical protein [Bacteriophage sp.]